MVTVTIAIWLFIRLLYHTCLGQMEQETQNLTANTRLNSNSKQAFAYPLYLSVDLTQIIYDSWLILCLLNGGNCNWHRSETFNDRQEQMDMLLYTLRWMFLTNNNHTRNTVAQRLQCPSTYKNRCHAIVYELLTAHRPGLCRISAPVENRLFTNPAQIQLRPKCSRISVSGRTCKMAHTNTAMFHIFDSFAYFVEISPSSHERRDLMLWISIEFKQFHEQITNPAPADLCHQMRLRSDLHKLNPVQP